MNTTRLLRNARLLAGLGCLALAPAALAGSGLAQYFKGRFGALEIFDAAAKLSFRVNPLRLTKPLPACATAHLMVAAAALHQRKLDPASTAIAWDATRYPAAADWPRAWQRPQQDLASALRYGTPWYFTELKTRLGSSLNPTLARFGLKVSGELVETWTISALDQVDWLKRLRSNALGLPVAAHAALLAALQREVVGKEKLYGVGGRCQQDGTAWLAWQVGWVERATEPAFYAINAEGRDRADLNGESRRIARDALIAMKLWQPPLPPVVLPDVVPVAPTPAAPGAPAAPAAVPAAAATSASTSTALRR